jgi:demethylmenaquinone methyltransferase/2-methoxy-6-polyprenyl-1,4-benzoquinol methylase
VSQPHQPVAPAKPVAEYFREEAGAYQEASTSGLWDWWRRRELAAVFRALKPRAGELVLDAGCGAGYYSVQLRKAGAEVIACDYVPAMARQAARTSGVPVFVADLHRFALAPRFDAVLCAGALEFCSDPETAVAQLATALGPGPQARLVLMLPSESVPGRIYRRFHRRHGFEIQLFSAERLRRMADGAGLRLVALRRVGFNFVAAMEPIRG